MISVIGLLLCFLGENSTKKQKQFRAREQGNGNTGTRAQEKHVRGEFVLKFPQTAPC